MKINIFLINRNRQKKAQEALVKRKRAANNTIYFCDPRETIGSNDTIIHSYERVQASIHAHQSISVYESEYANRSDACKE
ncbi:hypothetical protein CHS0354_013531 [Potamilus streckersoni]|uniref:Uncharacterized protein n=1 Tax=Potamilus streckersoni TaxID=2493646 RepID=A0AAE0W9T7_9BIVA|nr:hypothetical protein CHS0354_013531 [Potamilus streckersoni]